MPTFYTPFSLRLHYFGYTSAEMWVSSEVRRHTRTDVCTCLYSPRVAPVASTEHGQERVGQGAERQLGEAVAGRVPLPHRERLQRAGAAQPGQEPLHRGLTCGDSRGWRTGRSLPGGKSAFPRTRPRLGNLHPRGRDAYQEAGRSQSDRAFPDDPRRLQPRPRARGTFPRFSPESGRRQFLRYLSGRKRIALAPRSWRLSVLVP